MNLITDRTAADVAVNTDKGNYNYHDLNRVNAACIELVQLMASVGYSGHGQFKTDWTMFDYPTKSATDNYLAQIYGLIEDFYKRTNYNLPIDLTAFTHEQANDIEKALLDIKEVIDNIKADWNRYANSFSCGMNDYLLRGWNR